MVSNYQDGHGTLFDDYHDAPNHHEASMFEKRRRNEIMRKGAEL